MQAERIDASLLALLNETPGPWQVAELEREYGAAAPVRDAVAQLVAAGLAHSIEEDFVFASASGRYAYALGEDRG
jgi:hypothetical protein